MTDIDLFNDNYNSLKPIVEKTSNLTDLYFKKDKSKKVTNYIMSHLDMNV